MKRFKNDCIKVLSSVVLCVLSNRLDFKKLQKSGLNLALFAELKKKGKERKEQLFKVEVDNLDINKTSSTGKLLAITSNKRFKNVKK